MDANETGNRPGNGDPKDKMAAKRSAGKKSTRARPARAAAAHPGFRPCFTIESSAGQVSVLPAQRLPGGTRLHAIYSGGTVTPLPDSIVSELEGRVLTGRDWVFLREDDVAVFDARMTIGRGAKDVYFDIANQAEKGFEESATPPADDFLLNVSITGKADLTAATTEGAVRRVPVNLPMEFDGSGPVKPYTAARLRNLAANNPKYRALLQNQCVGVGWIEIKGTEVVGLRLDVYAMVPA